MKPRLVHQWCHTLGSLSLLAVAACWLAHPYSPLAAEIPKIALIADATAGRATQHGLDALKSALRQKGITIVESSRLATDTGDRVIVAGLARGGGAATQLAAEMKVEVPVQPEGLLIQKQDWKGKPTMLLAGSDDRGLMYALLEAADRIGWATDANDPFKAVRDTKESPALAERGLSIYTMHRATFEERFFDENYWAAYFDLLARNRFNSFVLIFGYENGGYFAPAYPYFFDVEGYPEVRVVGFSAAQQQKYLRALNRMVEMAHDRGLTFTAGLWDHIYRGGVQAGGLTDADPSKLLNGVPTGLNPTNLMAYSCAAFAKFLKLVPGVDAVQFRMHSESGLKPGAEMREFWKRIYQVVMDVRPNLRFEARIKEFPDELIDLALQMGVKLRLSTKYWAEQVGLPFHPTHVPAQDQMNRRHGYADLLRYPKRYDMHWQLWTGGTTRILLWGDPEYARRFVESAKLYEGNSFEVNEMLATKMEAQPHDAKPFELLNPQYRYYKWEFERYWHFYQVFGRISYNPNTTPETWQHDFQQRFGADAAPYVESALHTASWVLPRINASIFPYNKFPTTRGWVEKQRWEDLPAYTNSEASDTQQFQSFNEAAKDRLGGTHSAKLSPEANSAWFARTAREILEAVGEAEKRIGPHRSKEFTSTVTDLRILANLALYHSRRIYAGLDYALYKQSQDPNAFDHALAHETEAIAAWEQLVQSAGDVYTQDLMMGVRSAALSGHWKDELAALRKGLETLVAQRARLQNNPGDRLAAAKTPVQPFEPPVSFPGPPIVQYTPILSAAAGKPLLITVRPVQSVKSVRLRYRSVNQYQDYRTLDLVPGLKNSVFEATIPAEALNPKWDFMYFFEVFDQAGNGKIYPDLEKETPYIVVKLQR